MPGQRLLVPDEANNLPIHVIVGKYLDNFDTEVEKDEVRKMRYKVKYTKDDKEDIMTYNEIIDYMSRDTNETDGEYWIEFNGAMIKSGNRSTGYCINGYREYTRSYKLTWFSAVNKNIKNICK